MHAGCFAIRVPPPAGVVVLSWQDLAAVVVAALFAFFAIGGWVARHQKLRRFRVGFFVEREVEKEDEEQDESEWPTQH